MNAFDVVICGGLQLDLMVAAPRLPSPLETTLGTDWGLKAGGHGFRQAAAAAAAGARAAMIGAVGEDDFGRLIISAIAETGIDAAGVTVTPGARSGLGVAIVEYAGDFGAVAVSGANLALLPEQALACWSNLSGGKVLLLGSELSQAVNLALAESARRDGARILLGATPLRPLDPRLLALCDMVIMERGQATLTVGFSVTGRASAERAASVIAGSARAAMIMTEDGFACCEAGSRPFFVAAAHDDDGAPDALDRIIGEAAAAMARGARPQQWLLPFQPETLPDHRDGDF